MPPSSMWFMWLWNMLSALFILGLFFLLFLSRFLVFGQKCNYWPSFELGNAAVEGSGVVSEHVSELLS